MRVTTRACAFGLYVFIATDTAVRAQETPKAEQTESATLKASAIESRQLIPFLEGTDVFATRAGTVFEANIFPHLVAWQNFIDSISVQDLRRPGDDSTAMAIRVKNNLQRIRWSISGTPAVRIRMYNDVSNPVRTPSYMPRGNVQMFWANVPRVLDQVNVKRTRPKEMTPRMNLWELHFIVGHHSNGQDGCFWKGQQRVENTESCTPAVTPLTAAEARVLINKHDGSFSTNYVRAGMNYRLNWINADTLVAYRELSAGVEFERHPSSWMDAHEVGLYGQSRVNTSVAYSVRGYKHLCPTRADIRNALTYLNGVPSYMSNWAETFQVSCVPTSAGGWGAFVRYYRGQDYYNIGFLEEISRIQVGVTFNQDGFFRFKKVTAGAPSPRQ